MVEEVDIGRKVEMLSIAEGRYLMMYVNTGVYRVGVLVFALVVIAACWFWQASLPPKAASLGESFTQATEQSMGIEIQETRRALNEPDYQVKREQADAWVRAHNK